jgi:multiple antibiotic resistance protein
LNLEPLTFSFGEVLTFFFVMLGPLKLVQKFAIATAGVDASVRRRVAWQSTLLSTAALLIVAFVGRDVLRRWHVSPGATMLAAAITLFLVAISLVVRPPDQPPAKRAGAQPSIAGLTHTVFLNIATPYGIAVLVGFMAIQPQAVAVILAALLTVMALDLVAMLFVEPILHWLGPVLQTLGAVLGVFQVALSIQMVAYGLRILAAGTGSG